MSADYTTTGLLANMKRRGFIPVGCGLTTSDLLQILTSELRNYIPAFLKGIREEFIVAELSIPVTSATVPIPARACGNALRTIGWTRADGSVAPLTRFEPETRAGQELTGSEPIGFLFRGNNVVLVPAVTSGTLVVSYQQRPGELVLPTDCVVLGEAVDSTTRSVSAIPSTFVVGSICDIVGAAPNFKLLAADVVIASNAVAVGSGTADVAGYGVVAINFDGRTGGLATDGGGPVFGITSQARGFASFDSGGAAGFVVCYQVVDAVYVDNESLEGPAGFTAISNGTLVPAVVVANPTAAFAAGRIVIGASSGATATIAATAIVSATATALTLSGLSGAFIDGEVLAVYGEGGPDAVAFTSALPSDVAAGDYLCLASETPIPQIPLECFDLLAMAAAVEIAQSTGSTRLGALKEGLKALREQVAMILSPRADGSARVIVSRSRLGRRGL